MFLCVLRASAVIFFAYVGFARPIYLVEEIKEPAINVPKGMFLGIAAAIIFYLAITSIAIGLALTLPNLSAQPTPTPDDSLIGIWSGETRFGPELEGELTVRRDGSSWRAALSGADARFALDSWKDAPTAALTLPGLMLLAVLIFSSAWLGFALLILRLGALQTWTLRTHPVIVWLLLSIGLFKFRPARSAMSARACRT